MSPTSLNFGLLGIGQATVRTITISNVGSDPVTVTAPTSTFSSAFNWTEIPTTALPPGGSIPLTVEFSPLESGLHTDTVSVISDAPGSPHTVSLRGRARGGTPQ